MNKIKIADEILSRFIIALRSRPGHTIHHGNLLDEVIKMHQPEYTKQQVVNYIAGHLRVTPSTLYDYHRVARLWTTDWREQYQNPEWTFYRIIDPTDPNDIELLEKALDEGWNVTALKEEKYPELKSFDSLLGRIISLCRKALETEEITEYDKEVINKFLHQVEAVAVLDNLVQTKRKICK